MSQQPRISVLLAVFNTDFKWVRRAIDSVLRQDFQDFELIVVDDGSAQVHGNQLIDYCRTFEDKITYLRHLNRGQARSINRALSISSGEFITFLDADDEYKPDHLSKCLRAAKGHDLIASTTQTVVDTEEDHYVPHRNEQGQLIHVDDCILFATLFGKREVFEQMPFQVGYAADAHFYEHASRQYKVHKADLRTYIYYRNNPDSICAQQKQKQTQLSG